MSRSTPSPAERLRRAWSFAARLARAAIGLPDYDAYVAHVRARHPDSTPMDREAFFRERMQARYGRGRSRCC
jgi:uncharacterized short protein YbdD (DUF466 family)